MTAVPHRVLGGALAPACARAAAVPPSWAMCASCGAGWACSISVVDGRYRPWRGAHDRWVRRRVADVVGDGLSGAVVPAVPHPPGQRGDVGAGGVVGDGRGLRHRVRVHGDHPRPAAENGLGDGLGGRPVHAGHLDHRGGTGAAHGQSLQISATANGHEEMRMGSDRGVDSGRGRPVGCGRRGGGPGRRPPGSGAAAGCCETTNTEENAIAAPAINGFSRPAMASGRAATL